jgi:predicted Rossmann fold flavoprotein
VGFLDLVQRHGIAWHEKTLGQLFCDGSARQIVAMLLDECERGGAEVRLGVEIGDIEPATAASTWPAPPPPGADRRHGRAVDPQDGRDGARLRHRTAVRPDMVPPRPALVPFTLGDDDRLFKTISGVACPSIARVGDVAFEEAALFTHRGLSGPAILQISSYWSPGEPISLDVLPGAAEKLREAKRRAPRAHLKAALAEHLPNRLAEALAERIGLDRELANVPDARLDAAADTLENLVFHPTGTEGYAKAEVTAGGVSTAALSSRTMEARGIPGLYFIGEAVDVTGWLGGYNFQWAWSSGVAAGEAVAARLG